MYPIPKPKPDLSLEKVSYEFADGNRDNLLYKVNDINLARFLEVQSQIEVFEKNGIFDKLRKKEEDFEAVEKLKRQAEINHRVLEEQTKKEKQDFENISSPNAESYFTNKESHVKAITKEKVEYEKSLDEFKQAQKSLKEVTDKYEQIKKDLENFKQDNKTAIQLYDEQMSILYSTFEGEYGSELENQLENEVNILTEKKDQLRSALHKWSNSKFLLTYAYNQLQCSEQRWSEMMKLDIRNQEKVIYATEVRNNLVAANQNLVNTRSYLKNVELPYCNEDDLKTLSNLAAGTYQDMLSVERQTYALNIIQILRKRCAALNQWFEQVIKETLVVDFSQVKKEFDEKSYQLKKERIRLLQEKIKEKTGKDVNLNIFDMPDNKADKNENSALINSSSEGQGNQTDGNEITEKPLSSFELPPIPSKDQILGNLEKVKKQYFEQVDNWNKHMDESKREADEKLQKMLAQYKKK